MDALMDEYSTIVCFFSFLIFIISIGYGGIYSTLHEYLDGISRIRLQNMIESELRDRRIEQIKNTMHHIQNTVYTKRSLRLMQLVCDVVASSSILICIIVYNHFLIGILVFIGAFVLRMICMEIYPKIVYESHKEQYTIRHVGYIQFALHTTYLFNKIADHYYLQQHDRMVIEDEERIEASQVVEDEIVTLLEGQANEGIITQNEAELVRKALEFNDVKVSDIQRHRTTIVAIENTFTKEQILEVIERERYSRIPVYEGTIDHIIGIVNEREFLSKYVQNKHFLVHDILREPFFSNGNMKISDLLPELQRNKTHMAIITDEYGGTQGLVTMEDILEELVGDIWDEHDEVDQDILQISDTKFVVKGEVSLSDLEDVLGIDLPDTTYSTVSGWLLDVLHQESVEESEVLEYTFENFRIRIVERDERVIRKVIFHKHMMNESKKE